jgi:hypothetical protein
MGFLNVDRGVRPLVPTPLATRGRYASRLKRSRPPLPSPQCLLAPPSLSRHNTLSLPSAAAYPVAGRSNCAEGGAGTTPFFCA